MISLSGIHSGVWSQAWGYSGISQPQVSSDAMAVQVSAVGSISTNGAVSSNSHSSETTGANWGENQRPEAAGFVSEIHGQEGVADTEKETSGKENAETQSSESVYGTREFSELSQAEKQLVSELQQRDVRVRNHEMSHLAAAGSLAASGASYDYKKGPDGNKYAVSGEVHIDSSSVPGDPEATLKKMQQVKRAALAPVDPSPQDRRVAAKATAEAAKARAEIMQQKMTSEDSSSSSHRNEHRGMNMYMKGYGSSQEDSHSFSLAV